VFEGYINHLCYAFVSGGTRWRRIRRGDIYGNINHSCHMLLDLWGSVG
jgi:hypothetical protein